MIQLGACRHNELPSANRVSNLHLIADELSLNPMNELPGLADRVQYMTFIRLSC